MYKRQVFAGTAFATESYSQTMKVTVVADNMSTGKVISEIEKQTDYLFVYNVNEVNLKRKDVYKRQSTRSSGSVSSSSSTDTGMERTEIDAVRRDVYKRQTKFLEACEQFERIMNDSGLVRLRRLSTDEIVGTEGKAGLIERYFSLMPEGNTTLQDIELAAREMRIGDNRLCLHTLSDAEDLPGKVATDTRYEKLSTDRSDCRLSFASPVGLLLSCHHI